MVAKIYCKIKSFISEIVKKELKRRRKKCRLALQLCLTLKRSWPQGKVFSYDGKDKPGLMAHACHPVLGRMWEEREAECHKFKASLDTQ